MLNVFVADDEPKICHLIKQNIHWNELQLSLLGEFTDGLALFSAIQEKSPDIVILDINMPGLNGIDVIQKARQAGITSRFIIISGYSEFGYAQSALKNGVSDYLLKPIDEDSINHSLRRIISEILIEKKQAQTLKQDLAYNNFMSHVLHEPESIGHYTLADANYFFHTDFQEGAFSVLFFKCDTDTSMETQISISAIQKIIIDFLMEHIGMLCYNTAYTQYKMLDIVVCLNYAPGRSPEILNKLNNLLSRINTHLEAFSITVTLGVSSEVSDLCDVPTCCTESIYAIRHRIANHQGNVILWEKCRQNLSAENSLLSADDLQSLQRALTSHDETLLLTCMQNFKQASTSTAPHLAYVAWEEILSLSLETLLANKKSKSDILYIKSTIELEMHNCYTYDALFNTVCNAIISTLHSLQAKEQEYLHKPIFKAKSYIMEHYAEDVKLETVAAFVGLSPAYFSNLFKKTTSQTFTDFITKYRMECAKHLLESSDLSIGQIANAVGYDEQRYFSKLFRKEIGIKPTDYRKLHYR